MNRTIPFALILLGGLSLFISCSKTPEEKTASLYKDAMSHLSKFDYDGTAKIIDKIGEIDPAHPLITAGKGMITEQHLWTIDAFDFYATLMKASPNAPEGFMGAYRIQKRLRAFDDALITADALAKIAPKNPEAISVLAEAILNDGLPQIANRIIDSAQHVGSPQPEVDFLRARAKFLQNNPDSAHVYAASAVANKTASPRYYEVAADYYETIGFADSAMHFSALEMEAVADQSVLWTHHFDRTLRLGYFAAARDIQRQMIQKGADSSVILAMQTEYFNATNRYMEASNTAYHLAAFSPKSNLMRVIYELQARCGMDDMATVTELLGSSLGPLSDSAFTDITSRFLTDYAVIEFSRKAEKMDALHYLDYVTGQTQNRRSVRMFKTELVDAVGYTKRADSLLLLYESSYSTQADWVASFGDYYARSLYFYFDSAKAYYEKSLTINPNYLPAFTGYVSILKQTYKYDGIEQLFQRFPHFAAQDPTMALQRATNLIFARKRQEAMPMFESAIALRSGDVRAINTYLDALDQRYDDTGKAQAMEILKRIAPDNPDIIALRADRAVETGDYKTGEELADKGLDKDPDLIACFGYKIRALYGLGRQAEALKLADSIYAIYPYDPEFVYHYSRLLTDNKINFDKAANLARGDVMYSNYQVRAQLQLIKTYYEMGRFDLSWNEASNISIAYPNRPEGFYRLALAGRQMGKTDVKEQLEQSIALGLGGPDLDNARKMLAELH